MSHTLAAAPADAPADAPAEARGRPARDPWPDNAKWVLVTLVVMGHGWAALPSFPARDWVYTFVYLFHMPAFVLVTGYLSRSFSFTRSRVARLVTTVVVPYLVFEGLLAGFRTVAGGADLHHLWLEPHWLMWYLVALFLWRLGTPALRRVPYPVPTAVAICLLSGLVSGDVLSLDRTMSLLPFFVAGLHATPRQVDLLTRPLVRAAAVGVLLLGMGLVVSGVVQDDIGVDWLYWDTSYHQLGSSFAHGVLTRLLLLPLSAALAVSFLSLVPRRATAFTRLGAASLVVYLFHGFVVKTASYVGLAALAEHAGMLTVAAVAAAAVLLSASLASPPVADRLSLVVDPVGAWRRRRAARGQDEAGPSDAGTSSANRSPSRRNPTWS